MNCPRVALVRTKYPRNIGMVSRAMMNFGVSELILIEPACQLNFEAREGAAQGQEPLKNVKIYPTWNDYFQNEPEGPRIGFSRRQGRRRPSEPWQEAFQWTALNTTAPITLIFGAEDHGLSSSDLEGIHRTFHFEIPGSLKSLNLSHAVLLALSQWRPSPSSVKKPHSALNQNISEKLNQENCGLNEKTIEEPKNAQDSLEKSLHLWLEGLNFDLSNPRWNAKIALKQFLMKASPSPKELQLFQSIVRQTLRKISPNSPPIAPKKT